MIQHRGAIAPIIRCAVLGASALLAAAAAGYVRVLIPQAPHVLVGSVAFLGGLVLLSGCFEMQMIDIRRDWQLALVLVGSCAATGLVARIGAFGLQRATVEDLVVVSTAAWVEESIFRLALPRGFARILFAAGEQTARVSAVLASQALFVASHFLPGTVRSGPDIAPALRLFAGGLLLWMIASRVGLMGAVVTHALLNLGAAFGDAAPPQHPTRAGMLLICVLALAALLSETASHSRQPLTPRNLV